MDVKKKYPCPVCGSLQLSEPIGSFDICHVCGWEDDYAGQRDPDGLSTHPKLTLNQAREVWANGGSIWPEYPNPKSGSGNHEGAA